MPVKVSDVRAHVNENIRHAATVIGRSEARLAVFKEIYRGKKKAKTADEVAHATGLSRVRVLQEGGKLAGNGIVDKVQIDGRMAYQKDDTYVHQRDKVLDLVAHPQKKERYPTKQEPRVSGTSTVRIRISPSQTPPKEVTIDDVDAFREVRSAGTAKSDSLKSVPESRIKRFLKLIVGERYEFKDWGGEKNDLFTNKLRYKGRRRAAAFALKGRATTGSLTPKKMGKNGDQIGRLFGSEAELFFVVYHSQVDQSVHEQMRAYAAGRALGGNRVLYCVIDGTDLSRLVAAYPSEYKASSRGH